MFYNLQLVRYATCVAEFGVCLVAYSCNATYFRELQRSAAANANDTKHPAKTKITTATATATAFARFVLLSAECAQMQCLRINVTYLCLKSFLFLTHSQQTNTHAHTHNEKKHTRAHALTHSLTHTQKHARTNV